MYTALGNVFADIVIAQSESENKDVKIARLEARVKELEAKLNKPVKVSTPTVEWYTPAPYLVMVRQVLGTIDLDPASNSLAQSWIQAEKIYTKEDNGLDQEWLGNVWVNPPYGRSVEMWLNKAINGYRDRKINACIMLLNRTGAAWYKKSIKQVTAICEVYRRIAFLDENGNLQSSPRYYNDFLYLGTQPEKFKKVFSSIGDVRFTNPIEAKLNVQSKQYITAYEMVKDASERIAPNGYPDSWSNNRIEKARSICPEAVSDYFGQF